jgi:hypothetical protein
VLKYRSRSDKAEAWLGHWVGGGEDLCDSRQIKEANGKRVDHNLTKGGRGVERNCSHPNSPQDSDLPTCSYILTHFFPLGLGLLITLMMEAVSTSETSVNIHHTTGRNIPEDSYLQTEVNCRLHVAIALLAMKDTPVPYALNTMLIGPRSRCTCGGERNNPVPAQNRNLATQPVDILVIELYRCRLIFYIIG